MEECKLCFNLKEKTLDIYKKCFTNDKYKIVLDEKDILLVKKGSFEISEKYIDLIINISKRYSKLFVGIAFIDISSLIMHFNNQKNDKVLFIRNLKNIIFDEKNNIDKLKEEEKYYYKEIELKGKKEEEIREINEKKCIKLFEEMFEKIDEEYNKNWKIDEWLKNIELRYHYLDNYFNIIKNNLFIEKDIDLIWLSINIDEICFYLKEDYKRDVEFYKKYKLKDGQTYRDIEEKKWKEFKKLLIEMLDFVGIKTSGNYSGNLIMDVIDKFPYYKDLFIDLGIEVWSSKSTSKDIIQTLDNLYRYFSTTYKNHKENLKIYEIEKNNI